VVLNKRKPAARKGKVTLLNASKHFKKGRPKNYLPEEDIRSLAATYLKGEDVKCELAVITRAQAEEADYNLSPSRWVGQSEIAGGASLTDLIEKAKSLANAGREIDEALFAMLSTIKGAE
jgi:type I restriction enzyme M protein